jgi:hypothetical protein
MEFCEKYLMLVEVMAHYAGTDQEVNLRALGAHFLFNHIA